MFAAALPIVFATPFAALLAVTVLATADLWMGAPTLEAGTRRHELDVSFFAGTEISRSVAKYSR